jgi:hypothetical protein
MSNWYVKENLIEKAKIKFLELYKRLVEHINTNYLENQKYMGSIPLVALISIGFWSALRVARSVLAFEKFGTETPESMQFSHKSNVNF